MSHGYTPIPASTCRDLLQHVDTCSYPSSPSYYLLSCLDQPLIPIRRGKFVENDLKVLKRICRIKIPMTNERNSWMIPAEHARNYNHLI